METYLIMRTGQPPLRIAGEILAEVSGQQWCGRERNRWYEITVYSVAEAYAVHVRYCTSWEGESGHSTAEIMEDAAAIAWWLSCYVPTACVRGYPPGRQFDERQARLLVEMGRQYAGLVGDILASEPLADLVAETA